MWYECKKINLFVFPCNCKGTGTRNTDFKASDKGCRVYYQQVSVKTDVGLEPDDPYRVDALRAHHSIYYSRLPQLF